MSDDAVSDDAVSDDAVSDDQDATTVGSVADEAGKLFEALQDWAKESGPAGAAGLGGLGEQLRSVNEHVATGGEDCAYCPVCQVITKVRGTSPQVRTHLAVAASSLLQAAAALLEARGPRPPAPGEPVTRIDLEDDDQNEGQNEGQDDGGPVSDG